MAQDTVLCLALGADPALPCWRLLLEVLQHGS